jgi:serine/threonine-protein kinase
LVDPSIPRRYPVQRRVADRSAELDFSHRTFGKYLVLEKLGEGGTSLVYRAKHLFLRRTVALKMALGLRERDPDLLPSFERSATLAARLDHPAIARVYDVDEEAGIPYLVLEYVPGVDLGRVLSADISWSLRRKLLIAREVAFALAHAHERGVIHGDLKPGNILVTPAGRAKVIDFGCERLPDQVAAGAPETRIGTPHYMSPEQRRGAVPDVRSDLYSLGITLFCMITGLAPFRGRSAGDLLGRISPGVPPYRPQDWAGVPAVLVPFLESLTAPSPGKRPSSASDAARLLGVALSSCTSPPKSLPRGSAQSRPRFLEQKGGLRKASL